MAIGKEKTNDTKISIVIGTLNRPQVTLRLLNELVEVSYFINLEVLVFDQSDEENYQKLKVDFPKNINFRLYRLFKPNTCTYLNQGWQEANSSIILYLDDDISLTNKTIISHINSYLDNKILGVAGRVINDGEAISDEDEFGKIKSYGAVIIKNFSVDKKGYVNFPYGCNMSFRKKVLEDIGGFDEKLSPPIYAYNEVDLGYRITKKWGNSIIFVPEALVYHHRCQTGGTRSYDNKEVLESVNFNYGYFLGKNFSCFNNILCLIRRSIFQILNEPHVLPYIIKGLLYAKQIKNKK